MSGAGSGIRAWMLQRLSAVYMAVFSVGMFGYICSQEEISYETWQQLFTQTWMQLLWGLMFVLLILHAWVGVRDIIIDYVHHIGARLFLYACVIFSLAGMMLWSLQVTLLGNGL